MILAVLRLQRTAYNHKGVLSRHIRLLADMKAIKVEKYGGPEVLQVKEIDIPTVTDNEILIRVGCAGVNPVDTYIVAGHHPATPPLPFTPGVDSAGLVHAVGANVTKFKKGDRVFTMRARSGAYAEYCAAPADRSGHLHERLSFEQGAALGVPYYTAYRALVQTGKAKAGEYVLVHGASGAVGLAVVQLAASIGVVVLGTASTEKSRQQVLQAGAKYCFDHSDDKYCEEIMSATGGDGVDMIIEMLANKNLTTDTTLIKQRGRIMVVGCRGPTEFNARALMVKECTVSGVFLNKIPDERDWDELHCAIQAGQASGVISPIVGQTYPLQDAAKAQIEVIEHRQGTQGKIVIKVSDLD